MFWGIELGEFFVWSISVAKGICRHKLIVYVIVSVLATLSRAPPADGFLKIYRMRARDPPQTC